MAVDLVVPRRNAHRLQGAGTPGRPRRPDRAHRGADVDGNPEQHHGRDGDRPRRQGQRRLPPLADRRVAATPALWPARQTPGRFARGAAGQARASRKATVLRQAEQTAQKRRGVRWRVAARCVASELARVRLARPAARHTGRMKPQHCFDHALHEQPQRMCEAQMRRFVANHGRNFVGGKRQAPFRAARSSAGAAASRKG